MSSTFGGVGFQPAPDTKAWAPLSNDGLQIFFFECKVGETEPDSGNAYCDWVCDDAAPGATVNASEVCVMWYVWPNGTWTYTGQFRDFNGFDKP